MPKYDVEIIERLRNGTNIVGPMEDVTSELFSQVAGIPGCALEIYPEDSRFEKISKINPTLMDPAANRIIQIVKVPLLATVLMGLIRRQPAFEQLHAWLTQGGEHDRSEFWLREVERIGEENPAGPEDPPSALGDDPPGILLEDDQGYLLPIREVDAEGEGPALDLAEVTAEEVEAAVESFFDGNIARSDEIWLEEVVV